MKERYGVKITHNKPENVIINYPISGIHWKFETYEEAENFIKENINKYTDVKKMEVIDLRAEAKKAYDKLLAKAEKIKKEWNF